MAPVWHALGVAMEHAGRFDQSVDAYDIALGLRPNAPTVHTHRGNALWNSVASMRRLRANRKAITLRPDFAEAYQNLALPMSDQGDIEEAINCYRKVAAPRPSSAAAHSDLIFSLQYDPRTTPQSALAEAVAWSQRHEPALCKGGHTITKAPLPDVYGSAMSLQTFAVTPSCT